MITVFGSVNIDLVTKVATIPRPGETVLGSNYDLVPGGKGANQALAARRAGARTRLAGAVGDDLFAEPALRLLRAEGVDLDHVARLPGKTGLATICVDEAGENAITVASGANMSASAAVLADVSFDIDDIALFQLEVPLSETLSVATRVAAVGGRTILSLAPFRPIEDTALQIFDLLIMNALEASMLADHLALETNGPADAASQVSKRLGSTIIITLGDKGAIAGRSGETVSVPAPSITPVDTTGAGDTFSGVLATVLSEGKDLESALLYATAAGALACTTFGAQTSFPGRSEIDGMVAMISQN